MTIGEDPTRKEGKRNNEVVQSRLEENGSGRVLPEDHLRNVCGERGLYKTFDGVYLGLYCETKTIFRKFPTIVRCKK